MAPPRSTREEQASGEAPPGEVLDAMRAYADAHQVQQILHVMMARLLEAQPLEPFDFLIKVVRDDAALDEIELKSKVNRYDLRRERTKKELVSAFYTRLMALQRTQHEDKETRQGAHLVTSFLLAQLRLEETREHLKTQFPKHYRDIIQWFLSHSKELKPTISLQDFSARCMAVLAGIASA